MARSNASPTRSESRPEERGAALPVPERTKQSVEQDIRQTKQKAKEGRE
jgi:hypothetical protein